MRTKSLMAGLAVTLLLSACATIMHGTKQDVGIASTPGSARVSVDNVAVGQTPMIAALKRGSNHIVRIEMDGYLPFDATITKKTSGWVWGNIVFGGLIGLVVDASTGGLYDLTPEQVADQLSKQTASTRVTKDGVYVFVVLQPDPQWHQIGSLASR